MRSHGLLGIITTCLFAFLLTSCANTRDIFSTQVRPDLTRETWLQQINTDPSRWPLHVDRWFYNGSPSALEVYGQSSSSYDMAMTMMEVRVPDFTTIQVDGPFKVQIVGGVQRNRVFVYGTNVAARGTATEIRGNTLYIHASRGYDARTLNQVIVRIGIRNLRNLYFNGTAYVEGKNICSDSLSVVNAGCGHITLTGQMNLNFVSQSGSGTTTIIGAYTPALNVKAYHGILNISGRVGIRSLDNQGALVNIIGADTDLLAIYGSNKSMTTMTGYINLKKLIATGNSRIYMYWVNSSGAYISIYDWSKVGLAGNSHNLNIELSNSSRFEGQYLHGDNIYVRTRGWSHANVFANKKLFAAAMDDSSIYFFGSPNVISRYSSKNGAVIPVWGEACPVMPLAQPRITVWKDK